jgi:ATP-dependent helicase/nuclease subunit B
VQIEQLRIRLRRFADWQAERNRAGWRIVFSENSETDRTLIGQFEVDGTAFNLRGRIDRVDYNESLRRLAILDYKTADAGSSPEQTHLWRDDWIDLQLPLYRHLVRQLKFSTKVPADCDIELGYIVLPLDPAGVGLKLAEWDYFVLQSADSKAREIVRAIRAGQFWPPTQPPPDFGDDVAPICQDRRMGGALLAGDGEAA